MNEKHIFTENAPQFFGLPDYFTAEEVTEMRNDFKSQKITVKDLKKAMGESPAEYLDFEYRPASWKSVQWTVSDYSETDDYVILDYVGCAG